MNTTQPQEQVVPVLFLKAWGNKEQYSYGYINLPTQQFLLDNGTAMYLDNVEDTEDVVRPGVTHKVVDQSVVEDKNTPVPISTAILGVEVVEERISPLFQDTIFVIMWKSKKSGGTYSILRKSIEGKDRFLNALLFMGVSASDIVVSEQRKTWVPVPKSKTPKKREQR